MKRKKKCPGYSLLETTLALSIVAVLVLVGSGYRVNNKKHQLDVAVQKVCSSLSLARFRAIYRQIPVKINFDRNFCELAEFDSQRSYWITRSRQLLEGVQVSANNSPVFYPQGTVSNLATIKIRNDSGLYQITVAITGRVKVTRSD